ncbi:hypothetical protein MMC26_005913 [Xylographa opegraphella]|nr:hypothetical protein [Xylographa opegraphella]
MGNCSSTEDYQPYPSRKVAVQQHIQAAAAVQNKERAEAQAKQAHEAYLYPRDPCYGWDPVKTQQDAVKLDPDNLQYRIGLLKLLGQRPQHMNLIDFSCISTVEHAYLDARAQPLLNDRSGELDICFVEAVLEIAGKYFSSSEPITSRLVDRMKEAITPAKSLDQSSDRLVNFASAQLDANTKARDYELAVLRYELAYVADPEPKYLLSLAEMTAVGPVSLTEEPSLAFQRAEAALQEERHLADHHEMDLLRVENFHNAEWYLDECDRLFWIGDVVEAEAKKCVDEGGDESKYGDDLERALHVAGYLDPPWVVDCRARQGILLIKQGQYEKGMRSLDWAVEDQPNNQKWLAAKKEAEASKLGGEAEYLKAYAGITDVRVLREEALMFWRNGQSEKSARVLEIAIARQPAWFSVSDDKRE